MDVRLAEEPLTAVAEVARIPIAFRVERVLDVAEAGAPGGLVLVERALDAPYVKDYDAEGEGGPEGWARRFDVAGWGLIVGRAGGAAVGAATVAHGTAGVELLEGRSDLAVLWDLRVAPAARGRGVGTALFEAAAAWAAGRGCRWLKVETQNVNVPACRFYAARGCALGAIHRFAYPDLPGEAQLLWYRPLLPA